MTKASNLCLVSSTLITRKKSIFKLIGYIPLFLEDTGLLAAFTHHSHIVDYAPVDSLSCRLPASSMILVIDTAPSLDTLLVNALSAATGVLVPFLPHPLSAEGIRQFSRLFLQIRTQWNPAVKLHRHIVADIVKQFGRHRLLGSIRTDIKLAEAFLAKTSVLSYATDCRTAADYRQLSQLLVSLLLTRSQMEQPAVASV
jgi:hypothetical protein